MVPRASSEHQAVSLGGILPSLTGCSPHTCPRLPTAEQASSERPTHSRLPVSLQQLPDGCKAPRLVCQLHFTSWPDFGVPFTPIGMLKFLKKVRTLTPAHAGPTVVHCRYVRSQATGRALRGGLGPWWENAQ